MKHGKSLAAWTIAACLVLAGCFGKTDTNTDE